MKTCAIALVSSILLLAASAELSAASAAMDVTVKQKNGKVVYQGRTDAGGRFATGELPPGEYTVELRAKSAPQPKGGQINISVAAGKGAPQQATAPAARLSGGIALNIKLDKASRMNGTVSSGVAAAQGKTPADEKLPANVKIIDGKRYVWVQGELGSNISGRWVEEGTAGAKVRRPGKREGEFLQKLQDQAGDVGNR